MCLPPGLGLIIYTNFILHITMMLHSKHFGVSIAGSWEVKLFKD